jgi:hypothetical protein
MRPPPFEDDITSVAHHLRADLDSFSFKLVSDQSLIGSGKRAEKVAKIVGERMKLGARRWPRTFCTTAAST